jgi:regulator of sigma E protease
LLYVIGLSVVILKVAIGLGFVIFVHELGHFVVAKLCGVKCEKFYLGFDIGGLKLCRFRWGETEYGVGILPLGGYVKMLGQEDNPARLREELERAKQKAEGEGRKAEEDEERGTNNEELSVPPSALRPPPSSGSGPSSPDTVLDPRSFLAKSVPQRMAIVSAGVAMNLLFAFLMAVVAFYIGVQQEPCVIGSVSPGGPAWQADLRVGDDILEIAGKKMSQFRDLRTSISLGDRHTDQGIEMLVRRAGVEKPFTISVKPDSSLGAFFILVGKGLTAQLALDRKTWLVQKVPCVLPGSPADLAQPAFANGDKIVQIDEVPIESYAQIEAQIAQKANREIRVTVQRALVDAYGKPTSQTERLTIPVAPNPMRTLGLTMKMGKIAAVQANSPAAADIGPGDQILEVDGAPVGDPMTLPDRLNAAAGKTVELTIQRKGADAPSVVSLQARAPIDVSSTRLFDSPVAISSLGIAYRVLNDIGAVVEGGPAAKAGLLPGDVIQSGKLIPPGKEVLRKLETEQAELTVKFTDTDRNWPAFVNALQDVLPGTSVELSVARGKEQLVVKLDPVDAAGWFCPDRGFLFEPMMLDFRAQSVGEAFTMGARETLDQMTLVFRSIRALGTAKVSPRALAGPVMIVKVALQSADEGTARLLLFLTLLSANLAVINFMPIPVLDGGLMMFLIYEGIRGKPADERVQVVLTYIGLLLIIALMVWTLGLDFGLISRW